MPLATVTAPPDPVILRFIEASGLFPRTAPLDFEPLAGGVSSDIWLVRAGGRALCVKRARERLKVAAPWRVSVARNATEAAWLQTAGTILPGAAPAVLAEDAAAGIFAMEYLPPATYPVWKDALRRGAVDLGFAAAVAARLVRIHSATARAENTGRRFATDAIFHAIRLEPYLLATARVHRDLAPALEALAAATAATRRALVHGDVSPKNILMGPDGPVFIDAECAWFGDPAFDLAFCLNHLLLKCLWVPAAAAPFLAAFDALASAYLASVDWEDAAALELRAARLLPGLFLARIDGTSPVEYVTRENDKARVRRVAGALLLRPAARLAAVRRAWAAEIGA
ncbi:MAG TPA: aminoglycoside phosphotransferase family protein [Stellaceae bacterium]|nr:aminoglycoside phosphotransferase family protein [Stellaceae bacterium]